MILPAVLHTPVCLLLADYHAAGGETLVAGLERVREELAQGTFPFRQEYEDIHMNIEVRLTELVGPVGGKLHTARSRNDQVATDMHMYIMDECRLSRKA